MFRPNNTALLRRASKAINVRGERTYGSPKRVPCAVVTLDLQILKTSVRADSSGSRGRAEEEQGVAKLLFPIYVELGDLDLIEVDGEMLEVIKIFPRRSVQGILDHYEVDCRRGELP